MADKAENLQPQSGAGTKERKKFRTLPESENKDEVGQDNLSLAPLLHWDTGETPDDKNESE